MLVFVVGVKQAASANPSTSENKMTKPRLATNLNNDNKMSNNEIKVLNPVEAYKLGITDGKVLALTELMIKILAHGYSVDNIKSEIDSMRDELKEMTAEHYDADAKADHKTSEQF